MFPMTLDPKLPLTIVHMRKNRQVQYSTQYSSRYSLALRLYIRGELSFIMINVARRMNFMSQTDIAVWESVLSLCIFILLGNATI